MCVINSGNGYDCVIYTNSVASSQYEINSCRVYLCVTNTVTVDVCVIHMK